MSFIYDHADIPRLTSITLTVIISICAYYIRPRARVQWGISHGFRYTISKFVDNPYTIDSRAIYLKNWGRASAEDVEICLSAEPLNYHVWPVFNFSKSFNPEGQFVITIPTMGPREAATIEMLQTSASIPSVLRVRTKSGQCKQVGLEIQAQTPRWIFITLLTLVVFGLYGFLDLMFYTLHLIAAA
jgi:hypothetical protein